MTTQLLSASLQIRSLATKYTTLKWPIAELSLQKPDIK